MTSRFALHHGECAAVLATLPSGSVDLVVTDPPYVCRYRDRSGRTVANDNHAEWIAPAFREVARVMKQDTLCVSFYGWSHVERFMLAWKAAGLAPVGHLVWTKDYTSRRGFLAGRHEQAFVLAKGNPPRPAVALPDVQSWAYSGNRNHPTEKAEAVIRPLIDAFSRRGDLVLDPFTGSGTTGIACARLDRRFVGVELDAGHYATAERRIVEAYLRADVMNLRVGGGL